MSDKSTSLTGPEYYLIWKLLKDIRHFKAENENSDRPIPSFVHRISNGDLDKFIDKMYEHMYQFDPNFFDMCW